MLLSAMYSNLIYLVLCRSYKLKLVPVDQPEEDYGA